MPGRPEGHLNENQPDHELQQIMAHFFQTEQARMDDAKKRLRTQILPRLVQHRVANIEAAYSGYGDSGAIDGIQFRDAAGQRRIPALQDWLGNIRPEPWMLRRGKAPID